VTVSAALLQGRMRHRWGPSDAVRKAGIRMQEFPHDFGDWHMTSVRNLDEGSRNQLECVSEMVRVYTNAKTGDSVSLVFIFGPTGPTAAHTPETCIGQREFTSLGERREVAVGNGRDRFWNKRFKATNVHGDEMSVYWAWNAGGGWTAPPNARYTFVELSFLYKVQVACGLHGPADSEEDDGGQRFLADFVPAVEKYIVPEIKD
jgi:hypothetical protein